MTYKKGKLDRKKYHIDRMPYEETQRENDYLLAKDRDIKELFPSQP